MSNTTIPFETDSGSPEIVWTKVITGNGSWFDLRLRETWAYRELILLLLYRNIVQTSRQTVLGPVWWLIQPLMLCFIYTLIFVFIAKVSTDGIPAILFFVSGLTLWTFFSNVLNAAIGIFNSSASICGRVYVPKLVVYASSVLYSLVQYSVQFLFLVCCVAVYSLYRPEISFRPSMWLLLLIIPYIIALGTGAGFILASLTYRYRDLLFMVAPALRMLRYLSAVMIPMSAVPLVYKPLFLWNPFVPVMEIFRWSMFGVGTFDSLHLFLSVSFTLVCLIVGVIRFSIVNRVCMDAL